MGFWIETTPSAPNRESDVEGGYLHRIGNCSFLAILITATVLEEADDEDALELENIECGTTTSEREVLWCGGANACV